MHSAKLNTASRQAALEEMAREPLDILVIGGGITGAGIALDAALRGLRVGIVEAQDWAAGTSSRSSKLVHGGLRYLYQLDFKLVHEALRERGLLLEELAPHLVKKLPLLWPFKHRVIERGYSTLGVGLYDAMAQAAHRGSVPIQRHLTREKALSLVPDLRKDSLIGAMVYYDARVDDARLVVTVVRTAAEFGALAAPRVMVREMTRTDGRVTGAVLRDLETGTDYTVRTSMIINATGVWTEETQNLAADGGLKVLASKGIHVVVPRERIKGETGMFVRTEKSVLFIIPWKRYWIIGTTDTPYEHDLRHPVATRADVQYVLDHANEVLEPPLTHDDVIGTYAGLRPLLQPEQKEGTKSTKVSREHTVSELAPGCISIAGGKLTTYRVMAKDAVDFALEKMWGKARAKKSPCLTAQTPLRGATSYKGLWNRRAELAAESGLSLDHIEDMLDRFGGDITILLEMIANNPDLGRPLTHAPEYLRAEVIFAVEYEAALHLEDVLYRRIRLNYEHADRGLAAATEIAELMGLCLRWDDPTREHEIAQYRACCEAEAAALKVDDEAQAQEIRDHHGDVTPMEL